MFTLLWKSAVNDACRILKKASLETMRFRGGCVRRIHKISKKGLPAAPIGISAFFRKLFAPVQNRHTVELVNLSASLSWPRILPIPYYSKFFRFSVTNDVINNRPKQSMAPFGRS